MAELRITLDIMLPMLTMLALGWLMRRVGWLKSETASSVNKLIFKLFLPVLIFNNIRTLDLANAPGMFFSAFIFLSLMCVWIACQVLIPRLVHDPRKSGVMVQGIFRSNFAALGVALMDAMYGQGGMAALTLAMPIVVPLNNVLAVISLSRCAGKKVRAGKMLRDILLNPLIVGSILGAVFLFTGWKLPKFANTVCSQLGSMASPLALVVLGASLRWDGVKENRRLLMWTVIAKQAIVPAVMLVTAILLGFRGAELGVIIILFGAPGAISSYPMADAMGGDGQLAASQVVLTTVFSMGSLFIMIYLAKLLALL